MRYPFLIIGYNMLANYVFIWAYYLSRIAGFLKVLTKQA